MTYRHATLYDALRLAHGLKFWATKSKAPHLQQLHWPTALAYLRSAIERNRVMIVGPYAVMYDVVCDWFSITPVLLEEMVWRIEDTPASGQIVAAALKQRALELRLPFVQTADTFGGYMAKHYENEGFRHHGALFYMEVPIGETSQAHRSAGPS